MPLYKRSKKQIIAKIDSSELDNRESNLNIHLGQVISRGDRMEFTIQKSVELGVKTITPLWSERCGVKLNDERQDKKLQQWQKLPLLLVSNVAAMKFLKFAQL